MISHQMFISLLGGILIGFAVTILLWFNGRATGISGILSQSLEKPNRDGLWRLFFLAGLIAAGFLVQSVRPDLFTNTTERSPIVILLAGLFVGYGTVMGSGCTSGHGICGLSRFSIRSLLATVTFMFFGFLTVQIINFFVGGAL